MQQILKVNPGTLSNMAEQADKIADITEQSFVSEVSQNQKDSELYQFNKRMDEFAKALLNIQKQLRQKGPRSQSRGRAHTPTPNANSRNITTCYFHTRFGDKV